MADKSGKKFYRSSIPGLSVVVGEPEEGQVAPQTVRFVPFEYTSELGEKLVFGYLATDNEVAQKKLANDHNVVEIEEDSFNKYTDEKNKQIRKVAY